MSPPEDTQNTTESTDAIDTDPHVKRLAVGEPAMIIDRKNRRYLLYLDEGRRFKLRGGYIDCDKVIGMAPGRRIESSSGEVLALYRPTLEEYTLLMTRGAQIISPKDVAQIVHWGDIFPGAFVVEAGFGSGANTLGLLRAVGSEGRVLAFELREDFMNNGRKNIARWPEKLEDRLEVRLEDVHEKLGTLSGVDRIVLDLPDPWNALEGAATALKPGGMIIAYSPQVRQMDRFLLGIHDQPEFAEPEMTEVIVRPWIVDHARMRPELRIVGHTGFLARARRRMSKKSLREFEEGRGSTASEPPTDDRPSTDQTDLT